MPFIVNDNKSKLEYIVFKHTVTFTSATEGERDINISASAFEAATGVSLDGLVPLSISRKYVLSAGNMRIEAVEPASNVKESEHEAGANYVFPYCSITKTLSNNAIQLAISDYVSSGEEGEHTYYIVFIRA